MDIKLYCDIAEWLGKTNDLLKLSKIAEIADNGKYYVTMWGHYSAGKSKLINNLIGQDILPVRSLETTAVLTYIYYGTSEECHVIYHNGTSSVVTVDEARKFFQNTESVPDLQMIDHIEISINCDMLRNGLVLVDTPGVNTLIQHHQELAADAIDQSGKIVYVLGNSPSNVDRNFIREIDSCGVDILFVRTKCDNIHDAEESVEEALKIEKDEIENFLNRSHTFIPVSNEKGNKWNENIVLVRNEINKIADSIAVERENAIAGRLKIFADLYVIELEEACSQISSVLSGNFEKLNEKIAKCDDEVKRLEDLRNQLESKIEEKIEHSKKLASKDMKKLVDKLVDEFMETISPIRFSETMETDIRNQYDIFLQLAVGEMQLIMNGYFGKIIADEHEIIAGTAEYLSSASVPTYTEVQAENARMLEMYQEKLFEVKGELERIVSERKKADDNVSGIKKSYDDDIYEEALERLNQELKEIPSGVALRLADEQHIQPSSVFKKIGQTVDIGLLLLPGDMIVKGVKAAANTTKIAQMIHKMGKAGQVIVAAGGAAVRNANVIDHVRDAAYTLNSVLGKRRYSTEKEKRQAEILVDKTAQKMGDVFESYKEEKQSGSVLDALSVAYWTEKIGAHFDKPPKMEIDNVEEENRNRLRREITLEMKRLSDERILKKRELGLIETKKKELEMQEQEKRIIKDQIEAKMANAEADMLKKSRMQASLQYKQNYREYLEKNLITASKIIADGYYASANQNVVFYASSQNADLMNAIQEKKAMLERLVKAKEQGDDELKTKLELGQKYLASIKEMA